jgi:hypothetical protein
MLWLNSLALKINFNKSSMVPINISAERCQELADSFGCKVEALPFTYLGLPGGTTKQKMEHLIGIIERIDTRLVGIADFLSFDGSLTIVKSIITAIPNFAICTLNLPLGFLDHVEGSARGFF